MKHPKKVSPKASSSKTREVEEKRREDHERSVIARYCRPILHMRDQLHHNHRFGVVFGSGASKDLGFPQWDELIEAIAKHPAVDAKPEDYGGAQTSASQRLFHRFKEKAKSSLPEGYEAFNKTNAFMQSQWNEIIRISLYKDIPPETSKLMERDKYLLDFLPVIRKTRLTVNYNFDDTLERFLSETRTEEERKTKKGFRTVWTADVQLYAQNAVIYHPNGYLPAVRSERPSDSLIFLEDSFGDQLIDSASGHYSLLSSHYAQNTCLFVGLSLEDATLKHQLRKTALLHPGHVHYYVKYLSSANALTDAQKRDIAEANFEVYNLVTLFLTKAEISALGRLLSYDEDEARIKAWARELGFRTKYFYFLTGSVSVGKSTAVSFFRSLFTHDEWLERKLDGMEKDPSRLSPAEKKQRLTEIDNWIVKQWRQKNDVLRDTRAGLHVIDRCPLDAFAFTPEAEWQAKAKLTKEGVTPGAKNKLVRGMVILLKGHPNVMAVRAMRLQKDVSPELLDYRQALYQVIFDKANVPGVVEIDTREKSAAVVAKEISRQIHMSTYKPCNLSKRLEEIRTGHFVPKRAKIRALFMLRTTAPFVYAKKAAAK